MRLARRENNEITIEEKIETIKDLNDHQVILLERGDKLKKSLKNATHCFGNKNMYSVKKIKEALAENAIKDAKKAETKGGWCCVCVDVWTTNKSGACNDCGCVSIDLSAKSIKNIYK